MKVSLLIMTKNIAELDDSFFEDIGVSFEMPIHFSKNDSHGKHSVLF